MFTVRQVPAPICRIHRYRYGLATAVQTELARRGYYHGPIDGVTGSKSRKAIRAFQDTQGLPATGLIDPALVSVKATCSAAGHCVRSRFRPDFRVAKQTERNNLVSS
jgi:peptidoglycan hydrolase-like protein with peptidoglycan-binding domain